MFTGQAERWPVSHLSSGKQALCLTEQRRVGSAWGCFGQLGRVAPLLGSPITVRGAFLERTSLASDTMRPRGQWNEGWVGGWVVKHTLPTFPS